MNKMVTLSLFTILAFAQLAAPAWMIVDREWTLRQGESFKFRTAPVDPYDPFRGRYVALRLVPDSGATSASATLDYNHRAYAVLEKDEEGFAKISEVRSDAPEEGDYVRVKINGMEGDTADIRWPIDRYYMDEALAPEAEKAYRTRGTDQEERKAHVTVKVLSGKAVLEELYIEGIPIVDYVRRELAKD